MGYEQSKAKILSTPAKGRFPPAQADPPSSSCPRRRAAACADPGTSPFHASLAFRPSATTVSKKQKYLGFRQTQEQNKNILRRPLGAVAGFVFAINAGGRSRVDRSWRNGWERPKPSSPGSRAGNRCPRPERCNASPLQPELASGSPSHPRRIRRPSTAAARGDGPRLHRFLNAAARFSAKARMPSFWSSVANSE